MTTLIRNLAIRKTYKYVGTYRDMDNWQPIGTFFIQGETRWNETFDGWSGVTIVAVREDAGIERGQIIDALVSNFEVGGCSCDHDCCGCLSTTVQTITHIGGDEWAVFTLNYRNV